MNGNSFNKHMGKKQFLTKGSVVRAIDCWVMEAQRSMWRGEDTIICITEGKIRKH